MNQKKHKEELAQKEFLYKEEIRKKELELVLKENALKAENEEKKKTIRDNIYNYVSIDRTYDIKTFGTENLMIYLRNASGYKLDKVKVLVSFYGNTTGRKYCEDEVIFENIISSGNRNQMKGPFCKDGKDIRVKIIEIKSSELGLNATFN